MIPHAGVIRLWLWGVWHLDWGHPEKLWLPRVGISLSLCVFSTWWPQHSPNLLHGRWGLPKRVPKSNRRSYVALFNLDWEVTQQPQWSCWESPRCDEDLGLQRQGGLHSQSRSPLLGHEPCAKWFCLIATQGGTVILITGLRTSLRRSLLGKHSLGRRWDLWSWVWGRQQGMADKGQTAPCVTKNGICVCFWREEVRGNCKIVKVQSNVYEGPPLPQKVPAVGGSRTF